jgi:hypothetical protein
MKLAITKLYVVRWNNIAGALNSLELMPPIKAAPQNAAKN